jgi:dolichyl-phosphate-mannose-protein mannosyltransferase
MADVETIDHPRTARVVWSIPTLLAVVTVLLRLPAFFSPRNMVIDDGVYGVSVIDMRHGLAPYRDVFSAQGPLHFPLLYAGDLLGFRTINAPRITPVLCGVVASIAVWAIARRLTTPGVALVAGLLVATTGTMLWTTGQVTGDGPATALAVCAVWAALAYRDTPSLGRALLTGVAIGAALAVKPLVIAAAIPVGWWLWSRRRADHVGWAAFAAVATWLVAALPWGLRLVWRQSIKFNTGAGPRFSHVSQLRKLFSTLGSRDVVLLVAVGLGLVAALLAARRGADGIVGARRDDAVVIAAWTIATAALLVLEPAMYRNHLAAIVPPLALLFAVRPPPLRWLAVALIVCVPWGVVHLHDILWPGDLRGADAQVVAALRALPPGSQAISDMPGFVWRAGLSTPRLMNDASAKRIAQRSLTTQSISAAAATKENCAVVIWSSRFGRAVPGLRGALTSEGYTLRSRYGHNRELWMRTSCSS